MAGLIIYVIRRVGGLEVSVTRPRPESPVIRRVGGLEVFAGAIVGMVGVIRRVGGLEENDTAGGGT